MIMNEYCNVKIAGTISGDASKIVNSNDYSIFKSELRFTRLSGKVDRATLNIKGENCKLVKDGNKVYIDGTLRTYKCADGKSQTVVLVYNMLSCSDDKENENNVELVGSIVNTRLALNSNKTSVCEARVEVKSGYNKMSRLTVVGWGITAEKLAELVPGTYIKIDGRLQSRVMHDDTNRNELLEIAIKKLEVLDGE